MKIDRPTAGGKGIGSEIGWVLLVHPGAQCGLIDVKLVQDRAQGTVRYPSAVQLERDRRVTIAGDKGRPGPRSVRAALASPPTPRELVPLDALDDLIA